MNEETRRKEFAEHVCQHVKEALPEELAGADVRAATLNLWADGPRTVLLVIRPWDGVTTGFCIDRYYNGGLDSRDTEVDAAAAIINDRRLYSMPHVDGTELEGGAVIYA